MADWVDRHGATETVAYVVDQGGGYESELLAAYQSSGSSAKNRQRLGGLSFGDSKKLLPLQAADWAAYESAKQIRVHLGAPRPKNGGKPWMPRWGLQAVVLRLSTTLGPEAMVPVAKAFGMDVVAWSQNLTEERCAALGVTKVTKDELVASADVLGVFLVFSEQHAACRRPRQDEARSHPGEHTFPHPSPVAAATNLTNQENPCSSQPL